MLLLPVVLVWRLLVLLRLLLGVAGHLLWAPGDPHTLLFGVMLLRQQLLSLLRADPLSVVLLLTTLAAAAAAEQLAPDARLLGRTASLVPCTTC